MELPDLFLRDDRPFARMRSLRVKDNSKGWFEFTDEQKKAIHHALETYLSDLRAEIVKTEKHEWREGLHHEKDVLGEVMEKLAA